MPILMLTAADRLDDKATGFGSAPTTTSQAFELQELVLRSERSTAGARTNRPPVRTSQVLRLDPFRREVHRDGRTSR